MTFDVVVTVSLYAGLFFIWLPWQHIKHQRHNRVLKVLLRAHRFKEKYRMLKQLNSQPYFRSLP